MTQGTQAGRLSILGMGPGDPELMTVKAARILRESPVIAWFCRHDRPGHARQIAGDLLPPTATTLRFAYPFTTEIAVSDPAYLVRMAAFYDDCARQVADHLLAGTDVALLCEGDPFLFGSAMYVFDRLHERFACTIVPGITAMSGCWSAAQRPMVHGDDVLCVIPGTLDEAALTQWLEQANAAVIMKLGRNLEKVRRALRAAGREARAIYVERATQPQQRSMKLADMTGPAPYFSIILVPGREGAR
ncbi:precorrin-2 C(20)-methyltransferase [Komagataeibacter rhaeticus]|uniref:Precorrin-2 C(20)-methyltransferase n=1 Tax=Komagataeibacter rhaeticus TaxID=215221 RepID=A0A181C6T5_9PROT|nr:precorrin-2 C(20)-methyltransferase [Komagataeibacter rhaeticus]ATU73850.1 precorrin-2 C(20)-methyltransferase [Komagataeibacter xylinus]EGG78436.1 Precorrin-2 C(20)-methyltransferase [Gluconacetobacter sp. SXCC-1]KDU94800.1 precorrin-2 C20-methyltransferase [Komagataeibacter rhaeticus AF1]MBL7240327.1 precorrin-2 C(20)-methyltransferase [Komagataeibacter rhaeticus]PYD55060.1 precorrin-2 C(20)-methyltransferase [Komagataeibacter rhaeticus]